MTKRMLIDALHPEEVRVVIADDKRVFDFDFVTSAKKQVKGNVYLAKVTRVEPSLQAAFVEYGAGKQGFLPFSEIHADYYQIPVADRQRLLEEDMQDEDDDEDEDDTQNSANGSDAAPLNDINANDSSEDDDSLTALPPLPQIPESGDNTDGEDDDTGNSDAVAQRAEAGETASQEATNNDAQHSGDDANDDSSSGEAVETLDGDEEIQPLRKKRRFSKRYKIQEVIRRGQVVLVQVIKEERGNKGASLTTYLSLAGRYCVLMPNSPKDGGISRKISGGEDRKRLKAISAELRLSQGMSVIIRTAGTERTRAEIKRDFDYLVKLWNQIRDNTLQSNAPALIYEESDIIKRAIRDQFTNDMGEIVVQGEKAFENARDFMKLLLPSQTPKIKHYNDPAPLFYAYDVEDQLLSMHDPVVKLRSGGYLVINPTEALISVDVNSGRATGERNIEETASKTNLEAAHELARQLRLRDLAGLIVIDFIDMMESRNRRAVEKAMKEALKSDRAKIQIGRISPFGLMEMSRQRIRPSISESNMVACDHCSGRGFVRSHESMSIQILRSLEKEGSTGAWSSLRLITSQTIALHLLNNKRDLLRNIEERHGITIQILIGLDMSITEYNLEKMRRSQTERQKYDRNQRSKPKLDTRSVQEAGNDNESDNVISADAEEAPRKRARRRRGGRGRSRRSENASDDTVETQPNTAQSDTAIDAQKDDSRTPEMASTAAHDEGEKEAKPRTRRRSTTRSPRGRKRWKEGDEPSAEVAANSSDSTPPVAAKPIDLSGSDSNDNLHMPKSIDEVASVTPISQKAPTATDAVSASISSSEVSAETAQASEKEPVKRPRRIPRKATSDSDKPAARVKGANGFVPDKANLPAKPKSDGPKSDGPKNDGLALPAFATQEQPVVEIASNRPAPKPVVSTPVVENTEAKKASATAGSPKKGWWQKMIELDD